MPRAPKQPKVDDQFMIIVNTSRDTAPIVRPNPWNTVLTEGHGSLVRARRIFRYLPSAPRCKVCNNPFAGLAGRVLASAGYNPSRKNPNLCSRCCDALPPGGAEVDVAILFADIRGSTHLSQRSGATDYAALLNRFYVAATRTLLRHDAVIDKLIGDEIMAFFVRGISGPDYRRRAVRAGAHLLEAVGYGSADGPWLDLGIAVNAGVAYVGNVGGSVVDFTALGDPVNVASRMQQHAGGGELLVARGVADELVSTAPPRELKLRGHAKTVNAFVIGARGDLEARCQATVSRRRTPSCSGRSGSILMPSSSQVP
jgi:adenylate cyclase